MNTLARATPLLWSRLPAVGIGLPCLLPAVAGSLTSVASLPHSSRPLATASAAAEGEGSSEPAYTIVDVEEAGQEAEEDVRVAWFVKRRVAGSTKKLVPLLRQIRGLSVPEAIAQMEFSDRIRGPEVAKAIKRAVKNADFYHQLTANELMIDQAQVAKDGPTQKTLRFHSRGRFGVGAKQRSRVTIQLREMTAAEKQALVRFAPGTAPPKRHSTASRAY